MSALMDKLSERQAFILRLSIGLVFGLLIAYLGTVSSYEGAKPDTHILWKQIAVSALSLGAFIWWAGAGTMRRISLLVWGLLAMGLIAFMAWHQEAFFNDRQYNPFFFNQFFFIYPFLFITHELISSGDRANKVIAPYALYFDEAWKRGVQLILALIFTGLFWGILALGAALLGFIGFNWLKDLLNNSYFAWAISGLALGAAVHLGDVQTKLLANVRTLVLGVLSWLLPVIVVIGVIFVVSLAFSGLQPLWNTKAASVTLLSASVALVLLINASYQQGDEERQINLVMKTSVKVGSGLLLILAGLATWAVWLRVSQYGFTPERVLASLGAMIAVLYGLGYCVAAVAKGRWMSALEPVNIGMAIFKALVFFAVLTPLADPSRLSVATQMHRLETKAISADKFDWKLLRFETGAYGRKALEALSKSKDISIKTAALKAQSYTDTQRWDMPSPPEAMDYSQPDVKKYTAVFPKSSPLPQTFLDQKFEKNVGKCLLGDTQKIACYYALIDLNEDAQSEIIILDTYNNMVIYGLIDKVWVVKQNFYLDENQSKTFKEGKLSITKPEYNDINIGETKLRI
jgi:hypothetical protein